MNFFDRFEKFFLGTGDLDEYAASRRYRIAVICGNVTAITALIELAYSYFFQSHDLFWIKYQMMMHLFAPSGFVLYFLLWKYGMFKYQREYLNTTPRGRRRKKTLIATLLILESGVIGYGFYVLTSSLIYGILLGLASGGIITCCVYWFFWRKTDMKEEPPIESHTK